MLEIVEDTVVRDGLLLILQTPDQSSLELVKYQ